MDNLYRDRFHNASPQQLIDVLNREAGTRAWVSQRGFYLAALKKAFLASGLDCSDFISAGRMTVTRVKLDGDRLVSIDEHPSRPIQSISAKVLHLVYGTDYGLVFVEHSKAQERRDLMRLRRGANYAAMRRYCTNER